MSCNVLQRWWHGRLRAADRAAIYPTLTAMAVERWTRENGGTFERLHSIQDRVDEAWAAFKDRPGQEHWHCACAERERAR